MKAYVVEKEILNRNISLLREAAGETVVWAVLKGNGYGLGVVPMAKLLAAQKIDHFAVTEVREARALREAGFETEPILMLRQTSEPDQINELLDLKAIFTVGDTDSAVTLNGVAAERAAMAEVHLKIDTGMSRYGFLPNELDAVKKVYDYQKNLAVTGIYTHFHSAFCNEKRTQQQFARFQQVVKALQDDGYETGMVHCSNSSAFLRDPQMNCDAVRIGSAFLGRLSFQDKLGLRRVGHAEASIEQVRWIGKGSTVGYGAGWKAKRPTRIAILSVGWYHGFGVEKGRDLFRWRDCIRTILSNLKIMLFGKRMHVTIGGQVCNVLGHIGMVNTVVDITDVECGVGDRAILQINPLLAKGLKILYR